MLRGISYSLGQTVIQSDTGEGRYKGLIDCKCDVKLLPDDQVATGCQPGVNQMGGNSATEVR